MSMEHSTAAAEVTFHHHVPGAENVKRIWKTFWVLLIITIIELSLGFSIYLIHKNPDYSHALVLAIKGVIVILSLAKAFYIVSIFMHLGDEIRNMIMTIVVPLMLFIWFISAFIIDGNSYKNLRNKYDQHFKESTEQHPGKKTPGEQPGKQ
jgi:cytochrome c oxidase subunit IV